MTARLHGDAETIASADLKACGALKYAEHTDTMVSRFCFQFEASDPFIWKPSRPFPREVAGHVANGGTFVAHNAGFERRVWNLTLPRQVPGLPIMRAEQQSCTLARALVIGLPRDLKTLARVLGCRNQKMDVDARLFKKAITTGAAPLTPDEEALFDKYNLLDVLCEAEVDAMLPELSQKERQIWLLDQRINDRGIPIDLPSVVAMQSVADEAIKEANREIRELTRGAVQRVTEAARLERYLKGRGFDPDGVSEFELGLIDFSEDAAAQKAVELRTAFGKSSIKKLGKMLGCVASDGRLHDQYGYSVAGTRRWAGQIVQFQNLPRYDEEKDKFRLDMLYALLERFSSDPSQVSASLRLVTAEPLLDTVSAGIRKLIKAHPGNILVGGDLKNVEGRGNAWLAGQDDKLDAFRAFDAGQGPDLYKVTYAKSFGVPVEGVTKPQRFLGKIQELACLGPDTQVLTNHGYVAITGVTATHKLWDGESWVQHKGVVSRGCRETLELDGLRITADHQIWTGKDWSLAQKLASRKSILIQSLDHAGVSLPCVEMSEESGEPATYISCVSNVLAGLHRTKSIKAIFYRVKARAVTPALRRHRERISSVISPMRISYPMMNYAADFSTALLRRARAAIASLAVCGTPMESGALLFGRNGAQIGESSLNTLSQSPGMISLNSTWTALITTRDMNLGIFNSLRRKRTVRTGLRGRIRSWLRSNRNLKSFAPSAMPVYDIAHAGPRNRFTVKTDSGHLIVHNCGYSGGVGAFLRFAENAGMNLAEVAKAVHAAVDPAAWRGVAATYRSAFDKHQLPEEVWTGIKILVRNFRAANDKIARSWYAYMDAALAAIERPSELIQVKGVRGVSYLYDNQSLWCGLPSGGMLGYWQPEIYEERRDSISWPDGLIEDADSYLPHEIEEFVSLGLAELIKGKLRRGIRFWGKAKGGWAQKRLYAGLLCENNTQAMCRDIQCDKMLNEEKNNFEIVCHTHDDIVSEIAASRGDRPRFAQIMSAPVAWAPGLPIAADCWEGIRYGG